MRFTKLAFVSDINPCAIEDFIEFGLVILLTEVGRREHAEFSGSIYHYMTSHKYLIMRLAFHGFIKRN